MYHSHYHHEILLKSMYQTFLVIEIFSIFEIFPWYHLEMLFYSMFLVLVVHLPYFLPFCLPFSISSLFARPLSNLIFVSPSRLSAPYRFRQGPTANLQIANLQMRWAGFSDFAKFLFYSRKIESIFIVELSLFEDLIVFFSKILLLRCWLLSTSFFYHCSTIKYAEFFLHSPSSGRSLSVQRRRNEMEGSKRERDRRVVNRSPFSSPFTHPVLHNDVFIFYELSWLSSALSKWPSCSRYSSRLEFIASILQLEF